MSKTEGAIGNNPRMRNIRTKPYRMAVRRVLDGASQVGDRDKFATVARLFFQHEDNERYRRALRRFQKEQQDAE